MPTHAPSRESTAERLRTEIIQMIEDEPLAPGDQMPTEQEFAKLFGVSRSTVREALRLLEQDGRVRAVQGKGRFVSAIGDLKVERPVTKYEGLTEMLAGMGYDTTTIVLDVIETTADAREAAALRISRDAPVLRVTKLRCVQDEPLVLSVDTLPRDVLPGPVAHRDWAGSLTRALELHGHQVVSSLARISAVELPEEISEKYTLSGRGPWLLITETCMTNEGNRVLYAMDYHRGDEIAFKLVRRR